MLFNVSVNNLQVRDASINGLSNTIESIFYGKQIIKLLLGCYGKLSRAYGCINLILIGNGSFQRFIA